MTPARYVALEGWSGYRVTTEGDAELTISSGVRFEIEGRQIRAASDPDKPVDHGVALPSWSLRDDSPVRFVFWRGRTVFGAKEFTGGLAPLAELAVPVRGAEPWLDGVALMTGGGVLTVNADGKTGHPAGVMTSYALAADAARAVAQTPFGRTLGSVDGGRGWRDLTGEAGEVAGFELVGADIALTRRGGATLFFTPEGKLASARGSRGARRDEGATRDYGEWPTNEGDPLAAAVRNGVPLGPRHALAVGDDSYGVVDLVDGRARDVVALPHDGWTCRPERVRDERLLLCSGEGRAEVYTVSAEPRLERSFPAPTPESVGWGAARDVFASAPGDAIGYLGRCEEDQAPRVDVVSEASPINPSRQRSRYFCVRQRAGSWVEHDVGPEDALDVFAWIPRPDGGAVALVGHPGGFLMGEPAVRARGNLRVLTVALEAPPLKLPNQAYTAPQLVAANLFVDGRGEVRGWLPSSEDPAGMSAITIDEQGRVVQHPVPADTTRLAFAGRFALASNEKGKLWESVDAGRSWVEVAPPPSPDIPLAECTEVGCLSGNLARVGWLGGGAPPAAPTATLTLQARYGAPEVSPEPLARLRCAFDGTPAELRAAGAFDFGVTAHPTLQRRSPLRIGDRGWLWAPQQAPGLVSSSDIEAAWLTPLDVAGDIHRATLTGSGKEADRSYYWLRLGYVLRQQGGLAAFVSAAMTDCPAGMYDELGVTTPVGGCFPERSVGVEVGGKVYIGSATGDLSVWETWLGRSALADARQRPARWTRRWAYTPDRRLGMGRRAGRATLVSFDAFGEAVLVPLEADGSLGPEERLSPLGSLQPATSPACRGADDAEALVVAPFEWELGLDDALPGVYGGEDGGLMLVRWSERRACLVAVELSVRDERFSPHVGSYLAPGTTHRVIARFEPKPAATLLVVDMGEELRQPLRCEAGRR